MTVTRNDVARLAGVSSATVSYVINDGPRPVAPETRARVVKAIEALGYKPSAVARNLRLQKTHTLGLILPDTHNPYFAEVARGVEDFAFENGYRVLLCHSGYSLERELEYVAVLRSERAAGVLLIPASAGMRTVEELAAQQISAVVLDRLVQHQTVSSVVADNFGGGMQAGRHLIALGHRRIACIARPETLAHSQERIRGFLAAMQEAGLPVDEVPIEKGGFRLANGREAAERLFELRPRPTALFAYNDIMAIGALRAAFERGLRVPEDLSVVGFDDIPQAAFTAPALTTVQQPKYTMGQYGAALLLNLITGRPAPADVASPLPVSLVVRESTGPAAAHELIL